VIRYQRGRVSRPWQRPRISVAVNSEFVRLYESDGKMFLCLAFLCDDFLLYNLCLAGSSREVPLSRGQTVSSISVSHSLQGESIDSSQNGCGRAEMQAEAGLPVVTSHCPGLVCYVEKTQPEAIPYLSEVKSAQQVLGQLVKQMLLTRHKRGKDREAKEEDSERQGCYSEVFVVSVQPCFDKKLEASRLVPSPFSCCYCKRSAK
jgi:hypothetical protein